MSYRSPVRDIRVAVVVRRRAPELRLVVVVGGMALAFQGVWAFTQYVHNVVGLIVKVAKRVSVEVEQISDRSREMSGTMGQERITEVPAGVCPDVANASPLITDLVVPLSFSPPPSIPSVKGVSEETIGDNLGLETATTTSGMRWAKWAASSPCKAHQNKSAVVPHCRRFTCRPRRHGHRLTMHTKRTRKTRLPVTYMHRERGFCSQRAKGVC